MANPEHIAVLDRGTEAWNEWRSENPDRRPDLSGVSLSRRDLRFANLNRCNLGQSHLNNTDLRHCNLLRAQLQGASIQYADLSEADATEAQASGANFAGANLTRATFSYSNLTSAHLVDAVMEATRFTGADLSKANLFQANLRGAILGASKLHWANLTGVDLRNCYMRRCDLTGASVIDADLSDADLTNANLRYARIIDSRLDRANLTGARVYGVAVWNLSAEGAVESDIVITPPDEGMITVDNVEMAQFVYLLLNSGKIRQTIDTITSKVVLILGRFTPERMSILQAIKDALRVRNYLPMLFDFAGPTTRDVTETVSTLAHLARFVIADITEAKSIPQELMAIVPNLPSVPVQPLLLASERPYGMFEHFLRYPWVLEPVLYSDLEGLLRIFDDRVILPAEIIAEKNTRRALIV